MVPQNPSTLIADTPGIASNTPILHTEGDAVGNLEVDDDNQESSEATIRETEHATRDLPRFLYLLYILNGLTLSLFMLPMMYVVNTRVQVPVAYVSTYGSVAFLPYSFKPIYAYFSSSPEIRIPLPLIGNSNSLRFQLPSRHTVYITLLIVNSVCLFLYACIPPGGVVLIFVVAFFKGVSDSWSELCLGLTLIDIGQERANRNVVEMPANTVTCPEAMTYDKIVSRFQAQAATARNIGSVIGGFITLLVFLQRYMDAQRNMDHNTEQLSGSVANGLLFLTSGVDLIGACVAMLCRNAFQQPHGIERSPSNASFSILQQNDDHFDDEDLQGNANRLGATPRETLNNNFCNTIEGNGLLLHDDRSYHSCSGSEEEVSFRDEGSTVTTSNFDQNETNGQEMVRSRASLAAIVALQLIIVTIVLKDPVSTWTSSFIWKILVTATTIAFVAALSVLLCNNSWKFCHRVGLFLILRNAIPSDAMVISSYTYWIFQSQPIVLQSLSVLSLVVRMASSWSYEKLWAKFSKGRALVTLIGFLALLAGLSSWLNIAVYWKYEAVVSTTTDNDHIVKVMFGITALATAATTFFSEWAFLPEVILASVTAGRNENDTRIQAQEGETQSGVTTESRHPSSVTTAVEYGSLIACIEFGDQLGSLAAAPIVTALGISREHNFQKMDEFLLICSISTIIGTIAFLPLIRKG